MVNKVAVGGCKQERNQFERTKPKTVSAHVGKKNERIEDRQIKDSVDNSYDCEPLDFDNNGTLARSCGFNPRRRTGTDVLLGI
jgi:hypothetical protein